MFLRFFLNLSLNVLINMVLTKKISVFNQMSVTGVLLSQLDASSHFYERVCPSIGQSVRRSAGHAFAKINENRSFSTNQSKLEETMPFMSSCNHSIMRTHRWPYGPCFLRTFVEVEQFLGPNETSDET
jgi:hypothetical protein